VTEPAKTDSVRPATVTAAPGRGSAPRWAVGVRALLGVAAIAGGVGVYAVLWSTRPEPAVRPQADRVITVSAVPAAARDVRRAWTGYGTARAMTAADVAAEVAGRVVEKPDSMEPGVRVERGQLIAALDPGEYADRLAAAEDAIAALEAQLERLDVEAAALAETVDLAEQSVALSERELDRAKAALARGAATENEIDRLTRDLIRLRRELTDARQRLDSVPTRRAEAVAQLDQQRASARQAERDLNRTRITAPIAGALESVGVDEGDWLGVGATVARIVDLSRVEVPVRLPASAAGAIRVGDEVRLTAEGAAARSWAARLDRIAPVADAQTRTITAYAVVEQPGADAASGALLPGRFLTAAVASRTPQRRVIIPRAAIVGDRVAIVGDGSTVVTRAVRVAHHLDGVFDDLHPDITEWAALDAGVEPGELVIITNLTEIEDGVAVRVEGPSTGDGARGGGP